MSTTFSLAAQTIRQPLRATPKRRALRMYGIQTDSRVSSSTTRRVAGNAVCRGALRRLAVLSASLQAV